MNEWLCNILASKYFYLIMLWNFKCNFLKKSCDSTCHFCPYGVLLWIVQWGVWTLTSTVAMLNIQKIFKSSPKCFTWISQNWTHKTLKYSRYNPWEYLKWKFLWELSDIWEGVVKIGKLQKNLLCKNDGCVIFRWPGAALPAAVQWPVNKFPAKSK